MEADSDAAVTVPSVATDVLSLAELVVAVAEAGSVAGTSWATEINGTIPSARIPAAAETIRMDFIGNCFLC